MQSEHSRSFDTEKEVPVLIIGAGAAGARTAIELQQHDITPHVIGKRDYGDAHTVWAAGGINASLGTLDPEDRWEIHAADTLLEGHLLNDPTAVELVTKTMPDRIRELSDWGMEFDRTDTGGINQRYFGAQSFRRTCYVGDRTGEAILETLIGKAQSLNIPYQENVMITNIITDDKRTYGAAGFDMITGETLLFRTDTVVIAAGGYSAVYDRHSSRDEENNGDATALAMDAGAEVLDMEFVQFHPTGMAVDDDEDDWAGRLVTEAVRGEGGRLFNTNDERFMTEYSPDQMELDARDVVARAIQTEVNAGRGTENGGVYLDISHRDSEFIQEKLPRMYERFQSLGIDLASEPVEVAPTAHYAMGGIDIDFETGETTVDGLYAVGEATAGVHGANRLGGNSLAETVAIGAIVGNAIANTHRQTQSPELPQSTDTYANALYDRAHTNGAYIPQEVMNEICKTMTEHGGITRDEKTLTAGLAKLAEIEQTMATDMAVDGFDSRSYEFACDVEFMLLSAKAILKGALERDESRGAHYRTDHPEKDTDQHHNLIFTFDGGDITLRNRDVMPPSTDVQDAIDEGHELDYHHLE